MNWVKGGGIEWECEYCTTSTSATIIYPATFLLASIDEVELSQVDTGKGLVLDATVHQLLLGQS